MRPTIKLCAALVVICSLFPAFGQADVAVNLHADRLLGQANSAVALNARVAQLGPRYDEAVRKAGLTSDEQQQLRDAIADRVMQFGPMPRRVDVMTAYKHGRVYTVRNAVMPAHTMGWYLVMNEDTVTRIVYIPQVCGNVSVITKRARRIARVLHARYTPTPPPVAYIPPPSPAPPVVARQEFPPAPVHHYGILPWLAGLLVPSIGGGGGTEATPCPMQPVCPP